MGLKVIPEILIKCLLLPHHKSFRSQFLLITTRWHHPHSKGPYGLQLETYQKPGSSKKDFPPSLGKSLGLSVQSLSYQPQGGFSTFEIPKWQESGTGCNKMRGQAGPVPTLVKAGAPGSQPPQRPSLSHFRVHSLPGLFPVGIGDIDYCRLTLRVHWGSKKRDQG